MPTHRRVKSKDEEIGRLRINDDFRPRTTPVMTSPITQPWKWRRRRTLTVIAAVVLLYLLAQVIPIDMEPIDERITMTLRPGHVIHGSQELREPTGAPPRDGSSNGEEQGIHYYEGPIKFYRLATSLRGISKTMGSRTANRNILFAASSLRSVANLMPMACAMAKWDRNYVHLAVLGRDMLPLEDILEVNGIDRDDCKLYLHDARADYAEHSTDKRAEVSVAGAMKHINDFMHPQAIVTDDANNEDVFFTTAMRMRANEYRRALIEIPDGRYEDFLWMTKLDSGSLASWFDPTIDVLVHVPQGTSGGLIRVVRSLERADYAGLKPPRLTIELPSDVETFARRYLESLDWPPSEKEAKEANYLKSNTLALRHRIPSSRVSTEQASLRFLESFYPASADNSYVLVLSPQVELDPLYLHYLHYAILEYRYSSFGYPQDSEDLIGISLDVPEIFLNGSRGLYRPKVRDMEDKKYKNDKTLDQSAPASFLYQAPSSTASLIFGDKWLTFHDFLKNRLAASHAGKASKTIKRVSETEPAWLEFLLELMQARGWSMLHPHSPFVTVHNELAQIPEEFMRESEDRLASNNADEDDEKEVEEPFFTAPNPPPLPQHTEPEPRENLLPLHHLLPFDGDLPELSHLPALCSAGTLVNQDTALDERDEYVPYFRREIGGCDDKEADGKRVVRYGKTDDLFCLPSVEIEYVEEAEEEEEEARVAEAIVENTEPPMNEAKFEEGGGGGASTQYDSYEDDEKVKATVETKEEVEGPDEDA